MRLVGSVLAMFVAAVLVVVAFLHFPVPHLQVKPLKPSERLPSLWDIGPPAPSPDEYEAARAAVAEHRRAAEAGSAEARAAFAEALRDGLGVERNHVEAVRLFRLAADQGSTRGMRGLGIMYMSGRGVALDGGTAASWFSRAAQRGDVRAELALGHLHEFGRGVPRDLLRAADVYKALAERGGGGAAEARSRLCRLRAYVPEAEKSGPRFGVCEP